MKTWRRSEGAAGRKKIYNLKYRFAGAGPAWRIKKFDSSTMIPKGEK